MSMQERNGDSRVSTVDRKAAKIIEKDQFTKILKARVLNMICSLRLFKMSRSEY